MKHANRRLFSALGIEVGLRIRAPRLQVYMATNLQGESLLLVRGSGFGPNWANLANIFEGSGQVIKILRVGEYWVCVQDCFECRELIQLVSSQVTADSKTKILVPDVGFVESNQKRKIDPRHIAIPAIVLVSSIALGAWLNLDAPEDKSLGVEEETISCALDLKPQEFQGWLMQQLTESLNADSREFVAQTELGLLNVRIDQQIGSTQKISGHIECPDGRSQPFEYRGDNTNLGKLMPLGPLDS